MKLFVLKFSFISFIVLLLSACSPHPGTGVWKANAENELGIARLVIGFEGRAEFSTSKQDNAVWHCFWGVSGEQELSLECTPSTNPDNKKSYSLSVNDSGFAELRDDTTLLATFTRLDENPSPNK